MFSFMKVFINRLAVFNTARKVEFHMNKARAFALKDAHPAKLLHG